MGFDNKMRRRERTAATRRAVGIRTNLRAFLTILLKCVLRHEHYFGYLVIVIQNALLHFIYFNSDNMYLMNVVL